MIPGMYTAHVKSFIYNNPTWTYRFWTDESGRKLLQKQHPHLVGIYDKFGNNVKRSDMLRYAVLYEYGGFYADFDMENFRSLNITTLKYACILPVEPFEHSALLYNKHFIINNAFIGCRPKHPFFKLLLNGLLNAKFNGDPVNTTGPDYVTRKFLEYNNINVSSSEINKTDGSSNSPFFYKGELKEIDNNAVYVPNSQYFMDKIDPMLLETNGKITLACKHINTLTYLKQRACFELSRREKIRKNRLYTFTVHHWYHLWLMKKDKIHSLKSTNIKEIVPYFIKYNG
jgi:mannosyltransferase OCH1-like enzyme